MLAFLERVFLSDGLGLQVFTQNTPPPGESGGLLNAIFGSAVQTLIATLIGTPIGILAGTYMAEYGRYNKLTVIIRFINDVLLSAPSIVVGLFVYEMMVVRMGHFSAWSGIVALSILVLPVVIRTTEDMLRLVPGTLREAGAALGAVLADPPLQAPTRVATASSASSLASIFVQSRRARLRATSRTKATPDSVDPLTKTSRRSPRRSTCPPMPRWWRAWSQAIAAASKI